ncbi:MULTISPECIES: class I SAM-dependent methyltransferase [Paraburkholderia]|uniref:hypothetical protein n=1 Tax=Paraburkholderia TaxID=1822464 RepID=UPI002252DBB7|nr:MULTISPECIES: hypothetical protein [Paraburkholderia]MCX4159657.1 hypothetical protein [Paraburkholderia aspalathi]MDN7169055.1 class I SAM-dependent methyltransferase [Paraburkholderia sp. SECH2]MDQ6397542.1 class I SAM-dependent methyltransferase [Paraburkholderia aspalathi]
MAHLQQSQFIAGVKQFLHEYFVSKNVLEIGSLDINGSVREFFSNCKYIGLDIGEGKGVDLVCPGQSYGASCAEYDVVISCEAMEHNPNWKETWINMLRVVKDDGLVLMTCATAGRQQHGTEEFGPMFSPLTHATGQNYYKNLLRRDFEGIVNHSGWFSSYGFFTDHSHNDLFFYGVGLKANSGIVRRAAHMYSAFEDFYYQRNIMGRY